jgi:hypothetical protein
MTKLTNILLGSLLLVLVVFIIATLADSKELKLLIQSNSGEIQSVIESKELNVSTLGGYEDLTRKGDGVTATSVSISIVGTTATATTQALASNNSIAYRRIQNIGTYGVTCQLDDSTSTLAFGVGVVLATTGTASIYESTLGYWGQIRCIATTSTGTLSVIEY